MAAPALQIVDPDGKLVGAAPDLSDEALRDLFVHMLRIRALDGRMLKLQRAGRVGFVGTATGLEAALVGAAAPLRSTDWLWSGLREGGAAVMRGLPLAEYVAQMYCNANDTAKGRQMCNHFQHKGTNYPSWSSVIGTQVPHGVGAAFASKRRGEDAVHVIHFGDGATSSNGFHSGLNFAAVWKVPAVFVCTDNGWAISVPSSSQTASESYAVNGKAYGVPGVTVDGNDVLACRAAMAEAIDAARAGEGPRLVVLRTYRMLGHSSSDDPTKYRSDEEVESGAARPDRALPRLPLGARLREGRRASRSRTAGRDRRRDPRTGGGAAHGAQDPGGRLRRRPFHLRRQYNEFITVAEKARPATVPSPLSDTARTHPTNRMSKRKVVASAPVLPDTSAGSVSPSSARTSPSSRSSTGAAPPQRGLHPVQGPSPPARSWRRSATRTSWDQRQRLVLDVGKLVEWKTGIVGKLTGGVAGLLKNYGASMIEGAASIVDKNTVKVWARTASRPLKVDDRHRHRLRADQHPRFHLRREGRLVLDRRPEAGLDPGSPAGDRRRLHRRRAGDDVRQARLEGHRARGHRGRAAGPGA